MPTENSTDRQRLLRLIDGDPKAVKKAKRQGKLRSAIQRSRENLALIFQKVFHGVADGLRSLIGFIVAASKGKAKLSRPNLRTINKWLIAVLVLLQSYLVYDFINNAVFETKHIMAEIRNNSNTNDGLMAKSDRMLQLSPLEYYIEPIAQKDIFNVDRLALAAGDGELTSFGGLKFVGVDWGDVPTAMIENTTEGKTYFVAEGDFIKEIEIKKVLKDRVIFSVQGNMYELK